ncbi:MAG: M23 family metallopeptidase [Anaerolineae bacterium]|nr:M23 family metallopeptidase [Gemmatimonadaceae bacterium]
MEPVTEADSRTSSLAPSALELEIIHLRSRLLIVPVAGVHPAKIPDNYFAKRGSRVHNAIDIIAPRGTPILSADEGRVLKLRSNASGGITIYATDPSGRIVYYYAHLERYRAGLAEGALLGKGDTIGHVGTTGNAPPGVPHLHFQVTVMHTDGKYWTGTPVDPRPFTALVRSTAR